MKDLLLAQIQASFSGPNTSHPPVLRALADLTAAHSAWKPSPQRHSIWQIVEHLRLSRLFWSEFLQGRTMEVEGEGWPEPGGDDDAAWQRSVAALSEAHERLRTAISGLSEDEVVRPPSRRPDAMPRINATLLQILLWEVPTHDAYHSGQIQYLRALQGV